MEADRWLGLDLRHLVALKAIADEGSFGRAAERLGYTQSAISQQIAALERIVGLRLIDRPGGPRPISLTEAGQILLRHADAIQARLPRSGRFRHAGGRRHRPPACRSLPERGSEDHPAPSARVLG